MLPQLQENKMSDVDLEVKIDESIKINIDEPKNYKVIFLNDNNTPMEWVVGILVEIFKHTDVTAKELMLTVHNEGSAVVGIYSYEIAEQKSAEAMGLSRHNGFPLQIRLEEE